jgi:hypothetical protein
MFEESKSPLKWASIPLYTNFSNSYMTLRLLLEEAVTKMVQLLIPSDKCTNKTKLRFVKKKTKQKAGIVPFFKDSCS